MIDWFAGRVAETYDGDGETERHGAVAPVVDYLEPLAGGGALELGIGTGRIALPLAARGVHVEGIDLSGHGCAAAEQAGRRGDLCCDG